MKLVSLIWQFEQKSELLHRSAKIQGCFPHYELVCYLVLARQCGHLGCLPSIIPSTETL